MPLVLLAVTFALMWVLFIRPQQRRVRSHRVVVAGLAVGDEVMTSAGLFGTITALDDEDVRMEVAPGVVVRFARGAVARSLTAEQAASVAPAVSTRPAGTAADRAIDLAVDRRPPAGADQDHPGGSAGDSRDDDEEDDRP
jgi:preprotein translocase subunit YajC